MLKGSKNVALNRETAKFITGHEVSIGYYNWIKDTYCPDEHFFSTLATLKVTGSKKIKIEQRFDQERYNCTSAQYQMSKTPVKFCRRMQTEMCYRVYEYNQKDGSCTFVRVL